MKKSVIILLCISAVLHSQNVTVTATVDSQSVVIGDWIRYSVEVNHPSGLLVDFPVLKDSIGSFDIVKQDTILRSETNGEVSLKKQIVLSKYDAGNFYIQPFVVRFVDQNGKKDSALSNPIPVEIRGVEVDTSQAIRDIKSQLTVPMSAEEIAVCAGIIIGLAAMGYGIYYYLRKKRRTAGEVVEEYKPNIPPHVLALMQLEALEAKHLWQAGEIKAYYSEATEILRRYFELRYGIMALEMTTGEVMTQLEKFRMERSTFNAVESLLSDADLVKFAKYQPIATENEQVIARGRAIVDLTKPIPETRGTNNEHPEKVTENSPTQ